MRPKKRFVYHNPLEDDFAGTDIKSKPLPKNYRYLVRDPFSIAFGFLFYWVIAKPILWVVGKVFFGIKVKGKKNLRGIRHRGVFFYSNHTQILDGWAIQTYVATMKRTYIVANQDATSIPGIRHLVKMLGCLPVPLTHDESIKFQDAVDKLIKRRKAISIYPEAHIWPYCTHIRPFKDDSFVYPAELLAPVIATCVTYRRRKIFKNLPPKITIHVSKPFYPNMNKSIPERKASLRKKVYEYMLDMSCENENYEYIEYVYEPLDKKE